MFTRLCLPLLFNVGCFSAVSASSAVFAVYDPSALSAPCSQSAPSERQLPLQRSLFALLHSALSTSSAPSALSALSTAPAPSAPSAHSASSGPSAPASPYPCALCRSFVLISTLPSILFVLPSLRDLAQWVCYSCSLPETDPV